MAEGATNKEIAAELGISLNTAKFHVAQVLAKLSAASRAEAVRSVSAADWFRSELRYAPLMLELSIAVV